MKYDYTIPYYLKSSKQPKMRKSTALLILIFLFGGILLTSWSDTTTGVYPKIAHSINQ